MCIGVDVSVYMGMGIGVDMYIGKGIGMGTRVLQVLEWVGVSV